ncbi:MAG: alginate O-acetyltransferase AlgF [Pseudobdellovibrionaceae bacterium]
MKSLIAFLSVLIISCASYAGEEDLYAPVPPADSSFVRTVNMMDDKAAKIDIDGSSFPTGENPQVSNYVVIKQGSHTVSVAGKGQPTTIEAKKYYTVAVMKDGTVKVMSDAQIEDPSKAMIYFYNFSDLAAATLSVPSHKAKVFENVKASESASRVINAVALDVAIASAEGDVAKVDKVELKRQSGTSVFLMGEKGHYTAFAVMNKVAQ